MHLRIGVRVIGRHPQGRQWLIGNGRREIVQVLAPIVMGAEDEKTYAEAAEELGITHANARILAFRLRKHLRAFVREEVAQTAGSGAEVDAELHHFFAVLGGG